MPEEENVPEDKPVCPISHVHENDITLEHARRIALDTAQNSLRNYGRRFAGMPMAFQPVDQWEETEEYVITLSFRPENDFGGEPGQERFYVDKTGEVNHRMVLQLPRGTSRLPLVLLLSVIGVVVVAAVVWGAFAVGLFGGDSPEQPQVSPQAPSGTSLPPEAQQPLDIRALGLLVFTSERDGNPEIFSMDATGSQLTRLTTNPATDTDPGWSPDGRKILFTSDREGNQEIFVMEADGRDQINLSRDAGQDSEPAWSPDGTKIAFTSQRETGFEVFTMHSSGLDQDRLSNNNGRLNTTPAWSPDGSKIAFTSYEDDLNISVMKSNGADEVVLTTDSADDTSPVWSPDGTKIAFNSWRDGNADIYVMNSDGTGQTRLTFDSADDLLPSWSREGSRIAFESTRDGGREIYMVGPDGTGLTRLTNGGGYSPAWSPVPAPGKITVYLVPSESNPQSLSLSNKGLGQLAIVQFPVEFDVPTGVYEYLRQFLWSESSLIFSGDRISGSWPGDEGARLVMQLNGPLTDANYYRCVALKIDSKEVSSSCGTSFDSDEFVTGGYTVEVWLAAPLALDGGDKLELSIVLGATEPTGQKVAPKLVFGGDTPLKTSFIEIGAGPR